MAGNRSFTLLFLSNIALLRRFVEGEVINRKHFPFWSLKMETFSVPSIAKGHDCEKILRNLRFIRPDGTLTVAAMLLFGKYTQRWMPMMTAKCICFAGNSVGSKVFRDKVNDADMEGNLLHQYDTIMDFFTRNLHNVQVGDEFNSMGKLENTLYQFG